MLVAKKSIQRLLVVDSTTKLDVCTVEAVIECKVM